MALPPQQFLQKKIFYLDVTENLHSKLESRIKQLGGKVNMAFDVHEITHVVTNRVVAGVKMLDPNTNQYISSIPPVEPPTTSQRGKQQPAKPQPKPKDNDILLIATKYSLIIFNQKDFVVWITPKINQLRGDDGPKPTSTPSLKRKAETQNAPQDPKRLKASTSDKKEEFQLTTRPNRSIKERLRQQSNVTERQKKLRSTSVEDLLAADPKAETKNEPPPTVTKSIKQFISDTRYPWILIEDIGHETCSTQEHYFKPQNKTFLPTSNGSNTFPKLNFFENTVASPFINNPEPKKSSNGTQNHTTNTQNNELLKIDHSGFCECCKTQFSNYENHVEGETHNRRFDEDIYGDLDKLLSNLPSYQENLQMTNSSPSHGVNPGRVGGHGAGGLDRSSDVVIIDAIDVQPTTMIKPPTKTVNGNGRGAVKDHQPPPNFKQQKDLNKPPTQDLKRKRI